MKSQARTVKAYLDSLPAERRAAINAVRAVILENLPKGYEEGLQYGAIGYFIPHSVYPDGYHCDPTQPLPFAGLASQKNYMSLYLFCIYGAGEEEARFRAAWRKSGKKLDMGKSCVRFKKIEDVPLDVIGATIKRITVKKMITHYEAAMAAAGGKRRAGGTRKKKTAAAAKKKTVTRKTAAKKTRKVARKKKKK